MMVVSTWIVSLAAAATPGVEPDPRLAKVTPAEVSQAFRNAPPWEGLPSMMLALGLVCCGLALLLGLRAYRKCRRQPPEWALFWGLAREIGLSWGERWLLWKISRRQGLGSPLALMLSAGTLDHHLQNYAGTQGPAGRTATLARGDRVRARLYDQRAARRAA